MMAEFDVSVICVPEDGKTMVVGLFNGSIQFWDVVRKELVVETSAHLADVTALVYNNDQSVLVSAGADYLINVWNTRTKAILFEIRE